MAAPPPDAGSRRCLSAAGRRAWAAQVPQIRIGLLGGENEADRLGRFEPYRALIERTFEVPVRLFPASDYAGVMQALGAGQLEVAGMGPSAYAGAWLDTNGGIEPLTITQQADGSIAYVAVMVVRRDSGIEPGADAWPQPRLGGSEFRLRIPDPALPAAPPGHRGGAREFCRTGFAGGHEQAVVAVLQRQYDAAVTWASGIGDVNQGYSRGNLRSMVEKGMLNMADLRIIWTSEPIMNGPLAVRTDLPQAFKADFQNVAAGSGQVPTSDISPPDRAAGIRCLVPSRASTRITELACGDASRGGGSTPPTVLSMPGLAASEERRYVARRPFRPRAANAGGRRWSPSPSSPPVFTWRAG